ncbi:hypothetical protein D1872_310480 [compost metagenome]
MRFYHRQTDPVHRNGTLGNDVPREGSVGQSDLVYDGILILTLTHDLTRSVHMTLHDMTAEPAAGRHRPFEIDFAAGLQILEVGMPVRLRHHIDHK